MTVGEYIAHQRKVRSIRQKDLASTLEISIQYMHDIEKGNRQFPRHLVPKLAAVFKIDPDLLYFYIGILPPDIFDYPFGFRDERILAAFASLRDALFDIAR